MNSKVTTHKIEVSRNGKSIFFTDSLHKAVNVCSNHYKKDGQDYHIDCYGDIELDKTVNMDGSFSLDGRGVTIGSSDIFVGNCLFAFPHHKGTVTYDNCSFPEEDQPLEKQ
jgi:hypothetical protein